MAEYIERGAALKKIKELQETSPATVGKKQFTEGYFLGLDEAEIVLTGTPAADVEKVRRGEWISVKDVCAEYSCSLCGFTYCEADPDYPAFKYCPNCGAKMKGGAGNG